MKITRTELTQLISERVKKIVTEQDNDIQDWDFAKQIFEIEESRKPNINEMKDMTAVSFIQAGVRHQRLKDRLILNKKTGTVEISETDLINLFPTEQEAERLVMIHDNKEYGGGTITEDTIKWVKEFMLQKLKNKIV